MIQEQAIYGMLQSRQNEIISYQGKADSFYLRIELIENHAHISVSSQQTGGNVLHLIPTFSDKNLTGILRDQFSCYFHHDGEHYKVMYHVDSDRPDEAILSDIEYTHWGLERPAPGKPDLNRLSATLEKGGFPPRVNWLKTVMMYVTDQVEIDGIPQPLTAAIIQKQPLIAA